MKKLFAMLFLVCCSFFIGRSQHQISYPTKQPNCLTEASWKKLPPHPRLFANNARITSLKLQNDEVSKNLLVLLKNAADKHLTAEKLVYPTGRTFKFNAVRSAQGRILTLALRICNEIRCTFMKM